MARRRPSAHIRRVRTKHGIKKVLVNPNVRKIKVPKVITSNDYLNEKIDDDKLYEILTYLKKKNKSIYLDVWYDYYESLQKYINDFKEGIIYPDLSEENYSEKEIEDFWVEDTNIESLITGDEYPLSWTDWEDFWYNGSGEWVVRRKINLSDYSNEKIKKLVDWITNSYKWVIRVL